MSGARERHLLGVWNPSYTNDAMEEHLSLLLRNIAEHRADRLPIEEVFVWWGKIRSENRQRPLAHLDEILALGEELEHADREAHLYLTDYRSLYVGELLEATGDDVRADDAGHVPGYYVGRQCDCWFRLGDIRRLVQDDTLAVIAELRRLRNTHYNDRPVSLYGGMVDLPLVVTREDGARFFDRRERSELLEGLFWAELDASMSGLGAVEQALRDDLLGEEAWNALEPSARTFVASAEQTLRASRGAPAADCSSVVINLAKAVEVQAGRAVRLGLARSKPEQRRANVDGRTVDLACTPLSLGALARVLRSEPAVQRALAAGLRNGQWLVNQGAYALEELARYRNPATHTGVVNLAEALRLRNQWLGVGCQGHLVQLAAVAPQVA